MPSRAARSPASVLLLTGFGLFVAVLVALVTASLARRSQPTFVPTVFPRPGARAAGSTDTITVDARDGGKWRYLSLSRGEVLALGDTAGWELAVRRYRMISWGGAAAIGPGEGGASGTGVDDTRVWVETTRGRDTVNAALHSWYRYSMVTHLLESRGDRYGVRTRGGGVRIVRVLSYYCPGLVAGCLTIVSTPGDRLEPVSTPVTPP